MQLWTVQPISIYEQLQKQQTYRCDESFCSWSDSKEQRQAYTWMAEQMKQKVGEPPEGVEFPAWAWHTTNGEHKMPDLRKSLFRNYEEPHVCIELDVPDDKVLLSDFDTWQEVLQDQYVDFSLNKEEYKNERAKYENLTAEEQQELKTASWERIFSILPYQNRWRRIGFFIQATFWEIKPGYVKSVRYIKGKTK